MKKQTLQWEFNSPECQAEKAWSASGEEEEWFYWIELDWDAEARISFKIFAMPWASAIKRSASGSVTLDRAKAIAEEWHQEEAGRGEAFNPR